MILIIDVCKEKMHYFEFVKPVEDIISKSGTPFITKHFLDVKQSDIDSCHRLIICGTSLQDFDYSKNIGRFNFLKSFEKPVLAICGGMQLLCMIYGCATLKFMEIGLKSASFNGEFLSVKTGKREVYCLHNMMVKDDDVLKKNFLIYARTQSDNRGESDFSCVQAVKHRRFKHYGVLFHPEVRNKDMITNFLYA